MKNKILQMISIILTLSILGNFLIFNISVSARGHSIVFSDITNQSRNTISAIQNTSDSDSSNVPGDIWAWGDNLDGQLGIGNTSNSYLPVQANISGVIDIVSGTDHNLALKFDGTVWAWGCNSGGQLGNGNTDDSYIPVQVSGLSGVVAIANGDQV